MFAYCENDVINCDDPTGYMQFEKCGGVCISSGSYSGARWLQARFSSSNIVRYPVKVQKPIPFQRPLVTQNIQKGTSGILNGASRAKTGPKPAGTGPHNQKNSDVANSVKDGQVIAGGQRLPERSIKTPGGLKVSRRPDILIERPDGSQYGINVGKTTKNGAPIKREADAINDLEDVGLEMHYVPYDRR